MTDGPQRLTLALLLIARAAAGEELERLVTYRDDRLSVRLEGVAVGEVLAELGRQAGAEIRGEISAPRDVTTTFEDVPLPEALHRLVGEQNFTLTYGEGGRLRAVELLGVPGAPTRPPPAAAAQSPPPSGATGAVRLLDAIERHPGVAVSGPLAEALGTAHATLRQLLDAATREQDPAVRIEAVRAALAAIDDDADLGATVVNTLVGMDEDALSSVVRSSAGERAAELVRQIATQARTPVLRSKAQAVLIRLTSGGG